MSAHKRTEEELARHKRFPEDHIIETLRGSHVPDSGKVLRAFADRASRIVRQINGFLNRARDPNASYLVAELAAIAVAVELIEKKRDENVATFYTVPALRREVEQLRSDLAAAEAKLIALTVKEQG